MITLREAFNICDIRDDDVIFLREEGTRGYHKTPFTGKEIRNKYDMRRVQVVHIRPTFNWGEYDGMEFETRHTQ